jgi:hypothetical protein
MPALGTFIAGAYNGTHDAAPLGMTQTGYELQVDLKAQMINETDLYGLSLIDFVQRGADCFMQTQFREWKAGPIAAAWGAIGGALGVLSTVAAPPGRLGTGLAKTLALAAVAGTPAATSPATLNASGAVLAPNFNVNSVFDSRLRELPIRFALLPYTSSPSTTIVFFTTT